MKKLFYFLFVAILATTVTGCSYDDSALWNKVDEIDGKVEANSKDIATLQKLVDALNAGKVIVKTDNTAEGYTLTFNDGTTVSITNGKDGATGNKGDKGYKGDTGDTGATGDSFFTSVVENDDAVVITLADGRVITLPKSGLALTFPADADLSVKAGETSQYELIFTKVDYCKVETITEGWTATVSGNTLTVTAPENLSDANTNAEIRFLISDAKGNCQMPKQQFSSFYDLRTLTFEDADYKGNGDNNEGHTTNYWTSKISSSQYGGGHHKFAWYDFGNTELCFTPQEQYCGEAVSNYFGTDLSQGNYLHDLQVYNNYGGYQSSKNFCTHFGYLDDAGYGMSTTLPTIYFYDKARVIDHLYVTNTTYVFASLANGDSFAKPVADDGYFEIVATGYDEDDNIVGHTSFRLANGRNIVKEWRRWDLSVLGKVYRITFNLVGSKELYGSYGLNTPGYFAYDDIAVRF